MLFSLVVVLASGLVSREDAAEEGEAWTRGRQVVPVLPQLAALFARSPASADNQHPAESPEREEEPWAITFSPGGLLFPYYIGVGYELKRLGMITPTTPLAGSSAGAIVATVLACDVPEEVVLQGMRGLVADARNGTQLNVALRRQLEELLPEDAAERAEAHGLTLGYLEVFPRPGPRLVRSWKSKADLIQVIGASCNFPFLYSRWPLVTCRRGLALDGFFSVRPRRLGCPPSEQASERTLGVTALPILPLRAFDSKDVIRPDGDPELQMPMKVSSWFRWAMEPAPDTQLEEMIELGRQHAAKWHREANLGDTRSADSSLRRLLGWAGE